MVHDGHRVDGLIEPVTIAVGPSLSSLFISTPRRQQRERGHGVGEIWNEMPR